MTELARAKAQRRHPGNTVYNKVYFKNQGETSFDAKVNHYGKPAN
jgi:hypothetical protein